MALFYFIIMAVIIAIVIFGSNTKRKNYDERQELIRGRGYKYGFIAMIIGSLVILYLDLYDVKVSTYVAVLIPLYAGVFVISIYDIINHAYFGTNEKHQLSIGVIFLIFGVLDGYLTWQSWIVNKNLMGNITSILLSSYFLVIGIVILCVKFWDGRDKD